jgi:hypothetical protein
MSCNGSSSNAQQDIPSRAESLLVLSLSVRIPRPRSFHVFVSKSNMYSLAFILKACFSLSSPLSGANPVSTLLAGGAAAPACQERWGVGDGGDVSLII